MARLRLSRPAQTDLARIFAESARRWGAEAERRYTETLAAAMRRVAEDPQGPITRARDTLLPGLRSLHLRHARIDETEARVQRPVHVLYYRAIEPGLIEIVRVLHERMEPSRQTGLVSGGSPDLPPRVRLT